MNRNTIGRLALSVAALILLCAMIVLATSTSPASASKGPGRSEFAMQTTPAFGFSSTTYTVTEGGIISIEVALSPTATEAETVEYLTVDGTAKAGTDYISSSGTLNFAAGDGSETFLVQTIQNSSYTGDRTVNLILRNPSDGTILNSTRSTAVLTIDEDEATPTATPKQATATPIFMDRYEPNNTLQSAFPTAAGATKLCTITLWPSGDVDFFRFIGKPGSAYEVSTSDLTAGLDTFLTVYNPQGQVIASNDDKDLTTRASLVTFSAKSDGFYFARIVNNNDADPANKTYCFEVQEIAGTATPTPLPTNTRVPGADICEYNGSFEQACLVGAGETYDMNFVPLFGEGIDNDFYRLWVKPGLFYTCEAFNLSSVNDTNMILYDQNQNGIGGNDDVTIGDFGSQVSFYANYTGWLYILVGPVAPPDYALSFLYTYSLRCTELVATPTATPMPTQPPFTGPIVRPPTSTPTPLAFEDGSATPIGPVAIATTTPTATPNIQILPLPTNTPAAVPGREINFDLTVYYDANLNFTPELTEGVEDMAVAVYDNTTNELLAFGYTNEAGTVRFSSLVVPGMIRISIPFMQFNQVVTGDSNLFIRVAPILR